MRRTIILASISAVLVLVAIVAYTSVTKLRTNLQDQKVDLQKQQIKEKDYQTELKQLNTQLDNAKKQDQNDNASSQQTIQQLQKDKQDLQSQLQAKIEEKSRLATLAASVSITPVAAADSVVSGCGDNSFANYIYSHESGCSTTITNAEGCIGIGQACPASKLESACPSLDYACENSFFTAYANSKYGGWQGAYNFWLQNHWW